MKLLISVISVWQGLIFLAVTFTNMHYRFGLHTGWPIAICLLAYILETPEGRKT